MESSENNLTPQQIFAAWVAMGPSGDRGRVEELIAAIECAAKDIIKEQDYLSDPDQWDQGCTANHSPLEYIQRKLKDANDPKYILGRCAELRELLNRILPPPTS